MAKKKRVKKITQPATEKKRRRFPSFSLPEETKRLVGGVVMFVIAVLITLSFFDLAGVAGKVFVRSFVAILGKAVFVFPLLFVFGGISLITGHHKNKLPVFLAIFILILGISGILGAWGMEQREGGWLGFFMAAPLLRLFGFWATEIIFASVLIIGGAHPFPITSLCTA